MPAPNDKSGCTQYGPTSPVSENENTGSPNTLFCTITKKVSYIKTCTNISIVNCKYKFS